ncbi:hypothetical protein ACQEVC_45310 [Plantactinospora sp. CA-294935]|uniref:hypothetical protein n=1 Tax=Plantactinospora sp. CA-294935 TaxID=3240012 RepID=UPI003D907A38
MTLFYVATATDPSGFDVLPWLLAFLVLWGVVYVAECAWWPYAHCRRCEGRGRFRRDDGKVWRRCRRCKGSGERIRFGRRVWNQIRRLNRDAT